MVQKFFIAQEKYELIVAYEDNFFRQNNISKVTIKKWITLFETYGMDGNGNGSRLYLLLITSSRYWSASSPFGM